jgi:hypothetical protein
MVNKKRKNRVFKDSSKMGKENQELFKLVFINTMEVLKIINFREKEKLLFSRVPSMKAIFMKGSMMEKADYSTLMAVCMKARLKMGNTTDRVNTNGTTVIQLKARTKTDQGQDRQFSLKGKINTLFRPANQHEFYSSKT